MTENNELCEGDDVDIAMTKSAHLDSDCKFYKEFHDNDEFHDRDYFRLCAGTSTVSDNVFDNYYNTVLNEMSNAEAHSVKLIEKINEYQTMKAELENKLRSVKDTVVEAQIKKRLNDNYVKWLRTYRDYLEEEDHYKNKYGVDKDYTWS